MDTDVFLVVKVLWKLISLICFRVHLEVNVHKNPTCFNCWSVSVLIEKQIKKKKVRINKMATWNIETFNKKIDHFSGHKKYEKLREQADKVISSFGGYGLENIICKDFLDRIIAMPLDYIQDWLDEKNELEWREQDKRMLEAIKGCWVDILEKYPNAEIHPIAESATKFYEEYGYEILRDKNRILAIKK